MGSFAPPPTTALAPGDRLDRYELLCVLAQGGMGTVWLARITGKHGFERLVALKTILATYENDRQFCDMFLDEARIAAQVDHENVVRTLEIGEDRGVLYHAMELVDGESLRKLYRDIRTVGAPFPLTVALRIAADTCAGLHAVHELRGPDGRSLDVVHRDVSPQNILITVRGTVKLIDFGVAKARERRTEETTAGTLKGKIEYMAPEQARGDPIDRRADVYAVGAVLYELLSGEPVRNTEDGRQLLALHELMTGAPYVPLHRSVPLPVRQLVDRALARNPEDRFHSAEEMRHALEQAMVTIGHVATSDDVASVLAHFSRERTQRRKEAIEAALRAARSADRHRSVHTVVAPLAPPSSYARPSGMMSGPSGTQIINLNAFAPGEGPSTGPSLRTMQGAAISEYPPPPRPRVSAGRVVGVLGVLSLVAVLGVTLGVVIAKSTGPQAAAATPRPPPTASAVTTPTGSAQAAPLVADPAAGQAAPLVVDPAAGQAAPLVADPAAGQDVPAGPDPGTLKGRILGASDAGVDPPFASPVSTSAPPSTNASASTKPASTKKGNKGKERAAGQKSDSDEYGF
jgi:serine/threonine-protein kinase